MGLRLQGAPVVVLALALLPSCASPPKRDVPQAGQVLSVKCNEQTPAPCVAACQAGDRAACAIAEAAEHDAAEPPGREPDSPKPPLPGVPRVLHVRDAKLHFAYDAPDDTWLGVGPREDSDGLERVWLWTHEGREIEVTALTLPGSADRVTLEEIAGQAADGLRSESVRTALESTELAGREGFHITIDSDAMNERRDFFLQRRGDVVFTISVAAPVRDPDLLARARAGLRFTE